MPKMNRISTCWLCDRELTESKEHIIPESMGGRRIVTGFICNSCNSTTGHKWDSAVIAWEGWKFKLLPGLQVNPQTKRPLKGRMTEGGQEVAISDDLDIELAHITKSQTSDTEVTFSCDLSKKEDLFVAVNKFLERNGQVQITQATFESQLQSESKANELIEFVVSMNGPKYYRSIVKTAMSMAFSLGIRPERCEKATQYLRDEGMSEAGRISKPSNSLQGLIEQWMQWHVVTISGSPENSQLLGEVVYFGQVAGVAFLSEQYAGPPLLFSHSVNLATGEYEDTNLLMPKLFLPPQVSEGLAQSKLAKNKSPMALQLLRGMFPDS